MSSLKKRILKFKTQHDLTYRELAEIFRVDHHQTFYAWLHTEQKETFGERIGERFKDIQANGWG